MVADHYSHVLVEREGLEVDELGRFELSFEFLK